MASSTESLTDAERDALVAASLRFTPRPGYYEGLGSALLVRWLLATGMHPCVLADPERHRLRLERERNGLVYAKWDRPKKRGPDAATAVPLGPESDVEWARDLLASLLPPRSERTYLRLIRDIGKEAGISGAVTPRTLRHTYLTQLARDALDPSTVVRLGNVSPKVAIQYVRGAAQDRDVELVRRRALGPVP